MMADDKAEDYLRRAKEAEEQAKSAMTPDLKRRWENAANGWRLMAEREQRRNERG
jgi:hypothetical protein